MLVPMALFIISKTGEMVDTLVRTCQLSSHPTQWDSIKCNSACSCHGLDSVALAFWIESKKMQPATYQNLLSDVWSLASEILSLQDGVDATLYMWPFACRASVTFAMHGQRNPKQRNIWRSLASIFLNWHVVRINLGKSRSRWLHIPLARVILPSDDGKICPNRLLKGSPPQANTQVS